MKSLVLFHGSQQAVTQPDIARCRPNNDYGRGFYCTADKELAREWACQKQTDGFVSQYELPLRGLTLVDLNEKPFTVLHWLEVLFTNRFVRLSTPVMKRGAQWLHTYFEVDLSRADIVHGYRADDSYFGFARAFLRNEITLDELGRAMKLGDLGTQYMVKSPSAFDALHFIDAEPVAASVYWPLQAEREDNARAAFANLLAGSDLLEREETPFGNFHLSDLMNLGKEELYAGLR